MPNLHPGESSPVSAYHRTEPAANLAPSITGDTMHNINISPAHLSPGEVQQVVVLVVVEHYVKGTEIASQI